MATERTTQHVYDQSGATSYAGNRQRDGVHRDRGVVARDWGGCSMTCPSGIRVDRGPDAGTVRSPLDAFARRRGAHELRGVSRPGRRGRLTSGTAGERSRSTCRCTTRQHGHRPTDRAVRREREGPLEPDPLGTNDGRPAHGRTNDHTGRGDRLYTGARGSAELVLDPLVVMDDETRWTDDTDWARAYLQGGGDRVAVRAGSSDVRGRQASTTSGEPLPGVQDRDHAPPCAASIRMVSVARADRCRRPEAHRGGGVARCRPRSTTSFQPARRSCPLRRSGRRRQVRRRHRASGHHHVADSPGRHRSSMPRPVASFGVAGDRDVVVRGVVARWGCARDRGAPPALYGQAEVRRCTRMVAGGRSRPPGLCGCPPPHLYVDDRIAIVPERASTRGHRPRWCRSCGSRWPTVAGSEIEEPGFRARRVAGGARGSGRVSRFRRIERGYVTGCGSPPATTATSCTVGSWTPTTRR